MGPSVHFRYWPRWAALLSAGAGLLTLMAAGASGGGIAASGAGEDRPQPFKTISGMVRGGEGTTAIENRLVEIVEVESGERHRVTTNKGGRFSVKVKPGTYRLQVGLLNGEAIVDQPAALEVGPDAPEMRVELVISTIRLSRPRPPVYQPASGLGAPVA